MARVKYSEKRIELRPLAAFDLETKGLAGEFITGAITTTDSQRLLFHSLTDLFEWIVNNPNYLYLAHNASGYEFSYLAPLVYDWFTTNTGASVQPVLQGDTRIIQLTLTFPHGIEGSAKSTSKSRKSKPTEIVIRDTLCLFNMSLEQVAEAFCPELPKLTGTIDFEKEDFNPENDNHIAYVFRDCDIVLLAYERFAKNMAEVFGSPLGITAGGTAINAFRTTIPEGHVYYRVGEEADAFIRKAYYGGLVLPGRNIGNWGAVGSIDVNGAYAYQMARHEFPIGTPTGTLRYVPGYIGFYHCVACVPATVFDTYGYNPVPRRDSGGLVWPTGTFETYISSIEMEYAQERGCTFDVLCGYIFTRTEHVFGPFIEKCQQMELAENGKYKPTIKLNRNALYGKFGAKSEHDTIIFASESPKSGNFIGFTLKDTGAMVEGMYTTKEKSDADYMIIQWAALITAYERLYVMGFIEEAYKRGAKNVYCDTDSVKCDLAILVSMVEDGFVPMGNKYGEFKLEDICSEFIVLGSKCFYGELEKPDKKGNSKIVKAKGIPTKQIKKRAKETYVEAMEALERPVAKTKKAKKNEESREIKFISVKAPLSIFKEKSSVKPIERKRKITDIRNSYSWQYANGKIYPHGYTNV